MKTYIIEPYYFYDTQQVDFLHALYVTTTTIAEWCDWYEARLLIPKDNTTETEKTGMLPENTKQNFISQLLNWITENSYNQETFALFLDSNPISQNHKFDHHDDTDCWYLHLSEEEYQKLQIAWKENNLPEDLFYDGEETLRLLKPLGIIGKIMTALGFTWQSFELYSP